MKELATSESAQLSYYELYITKYLQEIIHYKLKS